ncbi:probable carbohydrate esterase At4g34215 [Typha latifolia]|uniref:probable carbohydrate esterase At4g34215 n=1 Tax=Typha latifolia TaxID=4733 RepID=UPI003C2AE27A
METEMEISNGGDHRSIEPPTTTEKQIFILSGQSNMAGRGGVRPDHHHHNHRYWDGVVPTECDPNPTILRLSAGNQWELARDPLHADIDTSKTCGVGPGMPFANALLPRLLSPSSSSSSPALIGLVPCAVGGTAIKEWERGSFLYNQMLRRARESCSNGSGELKAVLWYQGESDTTSAHVAEAYGSNMEKLIHDVRSDLGSPQLPFIQVALASGDKPHIETVRKAQLGIDLPNVVCVDAMGLSLNADHLHLTTESQVKLGGMLAQAYIDHFLT